MEERRYDQIISTLYPKPPAAKRGGETGNGRRSELVLFLVGNHCPAKTKPVFRGIRVRKTKNTLPQEMPDNALYPDSASSRLLTFPAFRPVVFLRIAPLYSSLVEFGVCTRFPRYHRYSV